MKGPGNNFAPINLILSILLLGILALAAPSGLGAETITHRVVTGDTLYNISKRYGVSIDQIKLLNDLSDNIINLNQVLKIKDADGHPALSEASGTGSNLIPEVRLAADPATPLFTAGIDAEGRWSAVARMPSGVICGADSLGNRYFTGTFSGSKEFGKIRLESLMDKGQPGADKLVDSWIASQNKAGDWLWAKNLAVLPNFEETQLALAVDGSGVIYVAGAFNGELVLDQIKLRSGGGTDIFVAKLDQGGNLLWAVSTNGQGNEGLLKLEVAEDGGAMVCGISDGTLRFGSNDLGNTPDSAGNHFFLARLNSGGIWDWGKRVQQISPDCWGRFQDTDANGNTWIADNYYADPVRNPVYTGAMSVNSSLRMLDIQGGELWSQNMDGTDVSIDWISSGADREIFVAGTFWGSLPLGSQQLHSGDMKAQYYARFNREGNCGWARKWLGTDLHIIEADLSGNIYLVAKYRPYIDSGGQPHYLRQGEGELIVTRLDGGGNWLWVAQTRSGVSPELLQAELDALGNLRITGSCTGEISFLNLQL